jgi:hypothetical protein
MMASSVTDRWLVRRLPALAHEHRFIISSFRSHGYVETAGGGTCSASSTGAPTCSADRGQIDEDTAAVLKREARRRVEAGTFFAHTSPTPVWSRASPRPEVPGPNPPTPHQLGAGVGLDSRRSRRRGPRQARGDERPRARCRRWSRCFSPALRGRAAECRAARRACASSSGASAA